MKDMLIDMQSQLQTQILNAFSSLKYELNQWDKPFMLSNNMTAPSCTDYQNHDYIATIQNKIKTGDILLKKWNMNLYFIMFFLCKLNNTQSWGSRQFCLFAVPLKLLWKMAGRYIILIYIP